MIARKMTCFLRYVADEWSGDGGRAGMYRLIVLSGSGGCVRVKASQSGLEMRGSGKRPVRSGKPARCALRMSRRPAR